MFPSNHVLDVSPEMQADLDAYYDWLEQAIGEQELPEDQLPG